MMAATQALEGLLVLDVQRFYIEGSIILYTVLEFRIV